MDQGSVNVGFLLVSSFAVHVSAIDLGVPVLRHYRSLVWLLIELFWHPCGGLFARIVKPSTQVILALAGNHILPHEVVFQVRVGKPVIVCVLILDVLFCALVYF